MSDDSIVLLSIFIIITLFVILGIIQKKKRGELLENNLKELNDSGIKIDKIFDLSTPPVLIDLQGKRIFLLNENGAFEVNSDMVISWQHTWREVNDKRGFSLVNNNIELNIKDLDNPLVKIRCQNHDQAKVLSATLSVVF